MLKTKKLTKLLCVLLTILFVVTAFVSCGDGIAAKEKDEAFYDEYISNGSDVYYSSSSENAAPGMSFDKSEAEFPAETADDSGNGNSSAAKDPLAGRKVIKNVNMSAETKTFDKNLSDIETLVEELGGYVQSSGVYGSNYETHSDRRASYTLRIPAENLSMFMGSVGQLLNVISKDENVKDITDTYTDIESRLTALRTEEARLLELLSQSGSLSDLLQIESRLSEVRYEIENYTARIRGYDTLIAFSTVNLSIREVVDYTPEPEKDPTFGQRISKAFTESWEGFGEFCKDIAVLAVYLLPTFTVFAVIGGIIVIVIVLVTRKNKKK